VRTIYFNVSFLQPAYGQENFGNWNNAKLMGMEANRGRSGSIAAPANTGGYLAGPQIGYSRQEGAMSPFATTGRRRANDVRSPHPHGSQGSYYPRTGPTGSVHELRSAGLATGSVHELHQQHLQPQQPYNSMQQVSKTHPFCLNLTKKINSCYRLSHWLI
jgi:hypothetical protein